MALEDPLDDAAYSTTAVQFAEDATYQVAGDARDGTATKVALSVGIIRQGARPARQLAGQFNNFIMNAFARYMTRLRLDLENTRSDAVDAFIETNANLAFLEGRFNALQFTNFQRVTLTVPVPGLSRWNYALWNAVRRQWILVGDDEDIRTSTDNGASWSTTSSIAAVGANEDCYFVDHDTNGDYVVSTDTRYVFRSASGVWSKVDVVGAPLAVADVCTIAHDPIRNLWAWSHQSGFATSPTGAVWTPRTGPSAWSATFINRQMAANKVNGRIIVVASNGNAIKVATSDDGGVTYTNRADPPSTVVSPTRIRITHDRFTGDWYMSVSAGAGTTQVFRSIDDGVTWTLRVALTNAYFSSIAATSAGLVAFGGSQLIRSTTQGGLWLPVGMQPTVGVAFGVFAGEGTLIIPQPDYVYASARVELSAFPFVT
jgi:hypothetical protein